MQNNIIIKIVITIVTLVVIVFGLYVAYVNFFVAPSITNIEKEDSIRFDNMKIYNVGIKNHVLKFDKSTWCLLTKNSDTFDIGSKDWVKASNGYCSIIATEDKYEVYVKDGYGNYSSTKDKTKEKKKKKENKTQEKIYKDIETDVLNVYLYPGQEQIINIMNSSEETFFESKDNSVATVDSNGKVVGIKTGKTIITLTNNKNERTDINVVVTMLIKKMDATAKREYFTCKMLSEEEDELLDQILFDRVDRAGYGTRAGVVAAARFLTLESTYEVPYFYENGRLENYEPYKYVDGEGRYYHRGLYLSPKKTKELKASFVGPAMWGCKLQNYTDWNGEYVTGELYPNGLDCSGFVTWSLLNGGFDIGDIGAGTDPDHKDLTDLGEKVYISDELMASGRVKVGDLIGLDGHMAILVGWDENNYYIAESLNTTKGVVVTTVRRSDLVYNSIYKYIILMDSVYKSDGNLTNRW